MYTENPDVPIFSLHPGAVLTGMASVAGIADSPVPFDTVQLPAATILYLAAGKADWLQGRYVDSTWDLSEVERDWKEKIISKNALVSKLSIP